MTSRTMAVGGVALAVLGIAGYFAFVYQPKPLQESQAPQSADQKLNIDAICEQALAYMSFPDAASAEVFVAECKEGKHPEVIQQYKDDNGIGEGAAL